MSSEISPMSSVLITYYRYRCIDIHVTYSTAPNINVHMHAAFTRPTNQGLRIGDLSEGSVPEQSFLFSYVRVYQVPYVQ